MTSIARLRSVVVLVLFVAALANVRAQQPDAVDNFLRGIRELSVFYDQSTLREEEECGIRPQDTKLAVQSAIIGAGLKVALTAKDFSGPVAAILVSTMTLGPLGSTSGRCTTAVDVELNASVEGGLRGIVPSPPHRAMLAIISDGSIHSGTPGPSHQEQVMKSAVSLAQKMIMKVKLMNQ